MKNYEPTDDQIRARISALKNSAGNSLCSTHAIDARIFEEVLARREADREYFIYGIADPDGNPYVDESCVSLDRGLLEDIVAELNYNEGTNGYRVVSLVTPLTEIERSELHDRRKADSREVRAEHAEWSDKTFGRVGPVGPLKHLSKEALEAAAAPHDLSEWADMQFLLWDAQRRAGITDEQIAQAMIEKLAVNKAREWPEPKEGEPRMHIKPQHADRAASPLLQSFYVAYHGWLKNGANKGDIFDGTTGLCANAFDYFSSIGVDTAPALEEMHAAFAAAGLREKLPFNEDDEHYESESDRGECHLNPARAAWVEKQAAPQLGGLRFVTPGALAAAISAVRCFDQLSAELIAEEMFKNGGAVC